MKRIFILLTFALTVNFLFSDELMENLKSASDQVAQDVSLLIGEDYILSGSITFENKPVIMGDLFSDLLANRLLNNSRFKGHIIKGYSPGTFRISDAQWLLSGSLYQTGTSFFLTLYLNNSDGIQKKGWEFLIPFEGTDSLLAQSRIAMNNGGDIYEPNNSMETAVEMNPDPGQELGDLKIGDNGDEDWFYIDVEQIGSGNTMAIFSARTQGGMDTYMELYSPGNTSSPVVENDDGDDSNAMINYVLEETGRWYIKVRGYTSDDTGDYGLSLSLEMKEAGPGEPDNTLENASILEVEGDGLIRTIDYGDDYDYFKITLDSPLPDDKALVVQTYSNLDLTMTLLDSYDSEIMTNDDSGDDSNPQVLIPSQEEGTWYAVVYPYDSDNMGSYTVKAYVIDIVKDDYENDNFMEEASSIEIDGEPQERTFMPTTDEDWVRFVVGESGEFIIKTTGEIDTYLNLYDRYGEFIYEDDDGGIDNNALISQNLEEGVYYIRVTQYEGEGNVEDTYSLSVRQY